MSQWAGFAEPPPFEQEKKNLFQFSGEGALAHSILGRQAGRVGGYLRSVWQSEIDQILAEKLERNFESAYCIRLHDGRGFAEGTR